MKLTRARERMKKRLGKVAELTCGYCVLGLVAVLGSHCVRCGRYLGTGAVGKRLNRRKS